MTQGYKLQKLDESSGRGLPTWVGQEGLGQIRRPSVSSKMLRFDRMYGLDVETCYDLYSDGTNVSGGRSLDGRTEVVAAESKGGYL